MVHHARCPCNMEAGRPQCVGRGVAVAAAEAAPWRRRLTCVSAPSESTTALLRPARHAMEDGRPLQRHSAAALSTCPLLPSSPRPAFARSPSRAPPVVLSELRASLRAHRARWGWRRRRPPGGGARAQAAGCNVAAIAGPLLSPPPACRSRWSTRPRACCTLQRRLSGVAPAPQGERRRAAAGGGKQPQVVVVCGRLAGWGGRPPAPRDCTLRRNIAARGCTDRRAASWHPAPRARLQCCCCHHGGDPQLALSPAWPQDSLLLPTHAAAT